MKKGTKFLLSCLLMLGIILPGMAAAADGGYVGSQACAKCHGELSAAFAASLHARAWVGGSQGCESCHGPGGAHVDNPSSGTIGTFGADAMRSADAQSETCLECHASTPSVALWEVGSHGKRDVTCDSCHSMHEGYSPTVTSAEPCFSCHLDKKIDAGKQSRHPIREGKVGCGDCHNPHGTLSKHMVKADSNNELCYKCHADKRGPYMWEHPPVEENCATCHDPHGSRHKKMLVQKVPNLCQSCHVWSRHPGTPYDGATAFAGRSPSNRFFGRSCNNCHINIHGSMAPSDPAGSGHSNGKAFLR